MTTVTVVLPDGVDADTVRTALEAQGVRTVSVSTPDRAIQEHNAKRERFMNIESLTEV